MSLWNNLMNRIGYVRYSNGDSYYSIRQNNTTYISGVDKLQIALNNPVVHALITIRADYLTKAKFYQEINGEPNYDTDLIRLINKPNIHSTKEDFLTQYEWFKSSYGWVYQKPFKGIGQQYSSLYNLNPSNISFPNKLGDAIVWTNSDQRNYERKEFTYQDVQTTRSVRFEDVIQFYDVANGLTDCDTSTVTSPSKIDAVIKSISNIGLALDSENKVTQTNGREIIQSIQSGSNTNIDLPVSTDDRNRIEDIFNNRKTLSNGHKVLIPSKRLERIDMTTSLKNLGLHDSIQNNANIIAGVFGVPNELYKAFIKGDTFKNQEQAVVRFIQGTMLPEAEDLAKSWTSFFGVEEQPIKATYSHLPMMQVTEERRADKALKISTAIKNLVSAGLTPEDAREYITAIGIDLGDE